MIGIVVAAHGRLATELVATAELIMGHVERLAACDISPALAPQAMEAQILEAVRAVDAGDGVLVLSDLVGGTPCTRSMALCQKARVEVVTGVSLPMVLKAHSLRSRLDLRATTQQLVDAARGSIRWVTEALGAPQASSVDG